MSKKNEIVIEFNKEHISTASSEESQELCNQSCLGTSKAGRIEYSLLESLFLFDKGKAEVVDGRGKKLAREQFIRKATKLEPNFWIRYCVFNDLRSRGYIVKTALKFGADFRVYDRGVKPGEDHARWIVYPVHESSTLTWQGFAAKNRVAHSTRKTLLIGVVDEEGAVSYWEVRWMRP